MKITGIILISSLIFILGCAEHIEINGEQTRVIAAADKYLNEEPVTITSFACDRSAGGKNDYYSEGDYWWPNPDDIDGPFIRRDGLTNPEIFNAHREALRRLSIQVPVLVAAYKITGNKKYAEHAVRHLKAWFINPDTRMNANLLYAQAIKGIVSGRGIGIIDTVHLVEVAKAILVLSELKAVELSLFCEIKNWFGEYLLWMTTHKFGIEERDNGNNHSTCWAMQAAMYALLTDNQDVLNYVRNFYKEVLIPTQMDIDGSFPKELVRTKPYAYSIFNLDAMVMVCEIAGNKEDNLWKYKTADGRGIEKAVAFLFPYLENKSLWPYKKDISYWDEWPVRQPSLLFASINFNEQKYFDLWIKLNPDPETEEIIRNYPIRQPLLWIE